MEGVVLIPQDHTAVVARRHKEADPPADSPVDIQAVHPLLPPRVDLTPVVIREAEVQEGALEVPIQDVDNVWYHKTGWKIQILISNTGMDALNGTVASVTVKVDGIVIIRPIRKCVDKAGEVGWI